MDRAASLPQKKKKRGWQGWADGFSSTAKKLGHPDDDKYRPGMGLQVEPTDAEIESGHTWRDGGLW